ncbi:MAG: glycosyl transferase [Clostridia bacterium]|nr:glycosyl transferase [Clostridia bacterium]
MKVLILSCNTGQGHNSAAKAIKDYFEENGVKCDIKDALLYRSPAFSKFIGAGHVFFYRNLPTLFGVGYKFEENHPPKGNRTSLMYDVVIRGCNALAKDLESSDYSAVVCTHVFAAMMMTRLRKNGVTDIPTYLVATDYTCHPGTGETDVDKYFIPHADLSGEYLTAGIKEDRLFPTGIPVNPTFYGRREATLAKKELNLPADKRIVLIMSGSMGCGPIKQFVKLLPGTLPRDSHLVVICGSNKKLYKSIKKLAAPNVTAVGYTDKVSLYMDAASVILTKPGGLSSTESAAKHLPMLFIDAVPGCETRNFDFFISRGFADSAPGIKPLAALVCEYLADLEKTNKMEERLSEVFCEPSAKAIFEYVKANS